MLTKKNFVLNCEICDTRTMKEEDYTGYEKMLINTDLVLVNAQSKSILNRLPLTLNQQNMLELTDDVELQSVCGSYEISASTAAKDHTILVVNGKLKIHPDATEALEHYEKICVNGAVQCPKSMEGLLGKLSVNGKLSLYPDDCILLEKKFTLDQYFPLRARQGGRYYAEKLVVIANESIDLALLAEKGVHFVTREVLLPESMIAPCIPLFDEQTQFTVVPSGMKLLYGDTVLDEKLVRKEGEQLYIYGSAEIPPHCNLQALCNGLKKLVVKGTLTVGQEQQDALYQLDCSYEQLEIRWPGKLLQNQVRAVIDNAILQNHPSGVMVKNTATVQIAPDVPLSLIAERVRLCNCAQVSCTPEQEATVHSVCQNVAQVNTSANASGIAGLLGDMLSSRLINAEVYVL